MTLNSTSNERLLIEYIKEAFNSRDFKRLSELLERADPEDKEAKYYRALVYENGLYCEINLQEAIKIYEELYNDGNGDLRAGNNLARIYQKSSLDKSNDNYIEAMGIYSNIAAKIESPATAFYAQYRLARIEEEKLLNDEYTYTNDLTKEVFKSPKDAKFLYTKFRLKKNEELISKYDEILALLKDKDAKIARAKILYHQALLFKKSAQECEKILQDESIKSDKEFLKEKLNEYNQKLIEFLNQAESLGFYKASAEKFCIEVKEEVKESKKSLFNSSSKSKVLLNCNKALKIDPHNINAKLLKAETLLNDKFSEGKYQIALDLSAEVLKYYPQNKQALLIREKAMQPLVSEISKNISDKLGLKIAELLPKQGRIEYSSTYEKRKSASINFKEYIVKAIEAELKKQGYINYNNQRVISGEIFDSFWIVISRKIELALKDLKVLLDKRDPEKLAIGQDIAVEKRLIKDAVVENIQEFFKLKDSSVQQGVEIDPRIQKRNDFKKFIVNELYKYQIECIALKNNPNLKNEEGKWKIAGFQIEDMGVAVAPLLGPGLGAPMAGTFLAIKGIRELYDTLNQNSIQDTATKFAKIGGNSEEDLVGHQARAKEKFEFIAEEIIKRYGMQIDEVAGSEIEGLAKVATQKMLNNLHKSSSYYQTLVSLLKTPILSFISYLSKSYSESGFSESQCIEILLDGLTQGKAKENKPVKLANGNDNRVWRSQEIFEKPAVTNNGVDIFTKQGVTDVNKYGVRYEKFIPDSYSQIDFVTGSREKKEKFSEHKKLLKMFIPPEKEKLGKIEERIERSVYSKRSKKVRQKMLQGAILGVVGLTCFYAGAIVAEAVNLGLTAAVTLPFFTGVVLSSAVMPPIAIGLGITGMGFMFWGGKIGFKASAEQTSLDQVRIKRIGELDEKSKSEKELLAEQQEQRFKQQEEKFAKKLAQSANLAYISDKQSPKKEIFTSVVIASKLIRTTKRSRSTIEENQKKVNKQPSSFLNRAINSLSWLTRGQ